MAFLVYVAGAVVLWPVHRIWGSQRSEFTLALPGDRADRNPALETKPADAHHVGVTLTETRDGIQLSIVDDGRGFNLAGVRGHG